MDEFTFIELPHFTKHVSDYLSDDQYRALQSYLLQHPNAGNIVRGSGGCRKIRWHAEGRGKRGGLRVIYYYRSASGQLWMLTIYSKNEEANIPGYILRRLKEEIDSA